MESLLCLDDCGQVKETHPVLTEFSKQTVCHFPQAKNPFPFHSFLVYQHLYLRMRFFEHTMNTISIDLWGTDARSMFYQLNGVEFSFTSMSVSTVCL